MGRINPVPSEASNGATAAAIGQLHRSERARLTLERRDRNDLRFVKVIQRVSNYPGFLVDGEPCHHAVAGAIWALDRHPDAAGTELVELIQGYRRDRLARDVERGLFTQAEADEWLAGRLPTEAVA